MFKSSDRNDSSIIALTIGIVSITLLINPIASAFSSKRGVRRLPPKRIDRPASTAMPQAVPIAAEEVFANDELNQITSSWGDEKPEGKFIKDRHGFTHYALEGIIGTSGGKQQEQQPLVVLCHGLGTSLKTYQEMSEELVQAGFAVLMYDYYGHGYSKHGSGKFFDYDADMFVDQLEDLVDHVESEEGVKPVALCGHSTGGIVSVAANHRWCKVGSERSVVPKLVLFNPAFYASKPFVAKIADAIPRALRLLFTYIPPARVLIADSYLEAVDTAYAKDPATNEYIYPAAYEKKRSRDEILLGKVGSTPHPFLRHGIFNINCSTLRGDLLPHHRDMLLETLEKSESDVLWLWGKLDLTVPYEENIAEVTSWEEKYDHLEVKGLDRIGHESPYEDSKLLSSLTISFLK